MLKKLSVALAVVGAVASVPAATFAQVPAPPNLQLSFDADGAVNLTARGVTVRDILSAWARQCGCYVVNGDKLPGGPLAVPLQFEHKPQAVVLDSLLRHAAGYLLTPRRDGTKGPSDYETIYILATSSPTAGVGPVYPVVSSPAPVMAPLVTPGAPGDEIPPVVPSAAPGAQPMNSAAPPVNPRPAGGFVPAVAIVPVTPNPPVGSTAPATAQPSPAAPAPTAPPTPPAPPAAVR
jgi:hypothetical protein